MCPDAIAKLLVMEYQSKRDNVCLPGNCQSALTLYYIAV